MECMEHLSQLNDKSLFEIICKNVSLFNTAQACRESSPRPVSTVRPSLCSPLLLCLPRYPLPNAVVGSWRNSKKINCTVTD